MKIYLWSDGKESGPFTKDEIFSKLNRKEIDLQTQARSEQDTEWKTVSTVINKQLALFSVEQIKNTHTETPPPVIVPDFIPSRTRTEAPIKRKSGRHALAAVLLCLFGAIWVFRNLEDKQEPTKTDEQSLPITEASHLETPKPIPSPVGESVTTKPTVQVPATLASNQPIATPIPEPDSTPTAMAVAMTSTESQPPLAPEPTPQKRAESENPSPPSPASTVQESRAPSKPDIADAPTPQPDAPTPSGSPVHQTLVQAVKAATPAPQATPSPPTSSAPISDFFKFESVKILRKAPKDGVGIWKTPIVNGKLAPVVFCPCLEVKVSVNADIRSDKTFAKAYFYGDDDKLLVALDKPTESGSGRNAFSVPVLFYKDKPNRFFFAIPETVEKKNWKAIFVFGDKTEAQVTTYPATASAFRLDYPEKKLVEDRSTKKVARKPDMDPLIEHVVRTKNPLMPLMTLFLRPPKGISNASQVEGVMAICVLAGSVEEMKRELRKEEMPGDYAGLFSFANEHKLAILAWGSRGLWDPGRNYDDLSKERAKALDASFDIVSNAWARGVRELGEKYGIPQKNFLLWGNCGSAQFAARLCLRKPEYFLAVHIHMPGSYDKPTPEAAKVLWCLTIGELEGGYERSKRWVKTVREMGYPIVYKAIPGLGHAGHPDAAALGFQFFEFALQQKDKRDALDEKLVKHSLLDADNNPSQPWLEEFRSPYFYGDIVNQEMYPPDQVDLIPDGFRIALPTKEIALIWAKDK